MPRTALELPPLAERVHVFDAGAAHVLALPAPIDRVVSFEASFATLPDFAGGGETVQHLAVRLLDKGTLRRDRFALAEALEDRGAELGFSADGLRCRVSGRCLRDDLADVLAIAAEQLREPLFDEAEFEKEKARHAAALRRAMDDTGSQARAALARRMYSPAHPNHRSDPAEELVHLRALTVDDVRAYHAHHFGARRLNLVLVGDLDPRVAGEALRQQLGDWQPPGAAGDFATTASPVEPGRVDVPMPDKQNLDVRIGQPLAVRRDGADYLPLYVGVYVLGGNFSARLMTSVRDEQGLTYGIGARLGGVAVEHDAYFVTSVTLSGENLERGTGATLAEIARFAEHGITPEELDEKQTTLKGIFRVGLATTGGLAQALLTNLERGFDVGYLDRFPERIDSLDVGAVNEAVSRHIDPEALHVAIAGTFPATRG